MEILIRLIFSYVFKVNMTVYVLLYLIKFFLIQCIINSNLVLFQLLIISLNENSYEQDSLISLI